jgi:hypothetical protein
MFPDEKQLVRRIVEKFVRTGSGEDGQVQVIRLPDGKTSVVETVEAEGRSIFLDEYKVDGRIVWAGYSSRSGTVFLSQARVY